MQKLENSVRFFRNKGELLGVDSDDLNAGYMFDVSLYILLSCVSMIHVIVVTV